MTTVDLEHGLRRIRTPEGVQLPFEVARIAERAVAFMIDALIIHGTVFLVVVLAILAAGSGLGGTAVAAALVLSFLLRNSYFIAFEIGWSGQTPGKRWQGLRVITRDGGPLTAQAVFARNLTRDIEVFLPLVALVQPDFLIPGAPGWSAAISGLWIFVLAALPLLNRDRLRCGDLVGGTLVVRSPRTRLLDDLAEQQPLPNAIVTTEPTHTVYRFTDAQLDLYGVHELQVLEDVLRRTEGYRETELATRIAETIQRKIGWSPGDVAVDPHRFLLEFYKAQRGRLERGLLLGQRRERKRE